jgi:hypothetical protein
VIDIGIVSAGNLRWELAIDDITLEEPEAWTALKMRYLLSASGREIVDTIDLMTVPQEF